MQKFFRVTPFGKIECAPFIGILKDEPFVSFDGFILRFSLYHASLFSLASFPTTALTRAGRGGRSLTLQKHGRCAVYPHPVYYRVHVYAHHWTAGRFCVGDPGARRGKNPSMPIDVCQTSRIPL